MILVQNFSNLRPNFKSLDQKVVPFENSYHTKYIYEKLVKLNNLSIIFNILSIIISVNVFDIYHIKADLDKFALTDVDFVKDILLIICSICIVVLIGLEVLIKKYDLLYLLYKGKDKKECYYFSWRNLPSLLLNALIILIHPNYLFEHIVFVNNDNIFRSYNSNAGDYVTYHLNDIMVLGNLLKVLFVFQYMLRNLDYNSDVADRIW